MVEVGETHTDIELPLHREASFLISPYVVMEVPTDEQHEKEKRLERDLEYELGQDLLMHLKQLEGRPVNILWSSLEKHRHVEHLGDVYHKSYIIREPQSVRVELPSLPAIPSLPSKRKATTVEVLTFLAKWSGLDKYLRLK